MFIWKILGNHINTSVCAGKGSKYEERYLQSFVQYVNSTLCTSISLYPHMNQKHYMQWQLVISDEKLALVPFYW